MTERADDLPPKGHSHLISRTVAGPVGHEWTANEDDAAHHHGLIDLNEVPCLIALYWSSKKAGRTVHVGTYKLGLRALAKAGYIAEKPGRKVRVRFVRDPDGIVYLRVNESSQGLAVGRASFD